MPSYERWYVGGVWDELDDEVGDEQEKEDAERIDEDDGVDGGDGEGRD